MTYELRRAQWVPRPVEQVFDFFADAHNLEILTPAWLRFEILTSGPISISPGTHIRYRLRWHGVPLRWTTAIVAWQPPHAFEDLQISGPYALWRHTHQFEAVAGGTQMTDCVRYALPFGPLGQAIHALAVRRNVERIFDYRQERIRELFGRPEGGAG